MKYAKIETFVLRHLRKYNFIGVVVALLFFCFSLLPSLMPRTWLLQAVVSGLSLTVGYGVGLLTSTVVRKAAKNTPPPNIRDGAWLILVYTAPIIVLAFLYLGSVWQQEVRELLNVTEAVPFRGLRVFAVAFTMSVVIVWIIKHLAKLGSWLMHKIDALFPFRLSFVLSTTITIAIFLWVISGVFFNFIETQAYRVYRSENDVTMDNIHQPQTSHRSGTAESFIPWESLGRQGQRFIATGPYQPEIADFYGQTAIEPIRLYVGYDSAPTPKERAELVLSEIERTGAFERSVLVLALPTGTGWLEPKAIDAVEFMHGGDTAIVAQQYSYLPSWISFLVDKDIARESGRILFDAVHAQWLTMPEEERPEFYTYGLSLGAYGSQAAFSSPEDMLESIDGGLYQGSINDTDIWREITDNRDAGTPEWQPQYHGGESIRFASTTADVLHDIDAWDRPRVLYVQHASDPIVWFSFDLIFRKPDWLDEPRGRDVSSLVRWYPFVTFVQIAVDQAAAHNVTDGRGHLYGDTVIESWQTVTQPEGWTDSDTHQLYGILHAR